ncbi:hypothetical protein AWQ21_13510 [Picosynechococcus sp. PCC 7003]|uniref:DUF1822 family protein n=1 Tax=Picosynechococcus sp. PCC 7003 TaxID=374981 RepID=UPI0008106E3D|nr:DUF1822 family protein [Picosynechococcus sp. PCC 7003]ANV85294.1 hypothetical protein AWQ21_13510 [Picosynechococcus sp. PCC 7003]
MFTQSEFRLLIPEEITLSELDYALVQTWPDGNLPEADQWQAYLNGLGLVAFENWLGDRLPEKRRQRDLSHLPQVAYVTVGGFKVCLLAQSDYLDEQVFWPQDYLEQPELAAHFYGIVEVDEEAETVILRGISRGDRLQTAPKRDGHYRLSLDHFDAELNHFLADCRYLSPAAIPLPVNVFAELKAQVTETATKLGNWFDGLLDQGWQALDQLMMPEAQLAFATRNLSEDIQAGKLLDLGLSLGNEQVVLLVTLAPSDEDDKVRIQARLLPFEAEYLPADLSISLKSKSGKVLQTITSRQQDSYIQLKPFKGVPGKVFQVEVSGDGCTVNETFEI